MRWLASSEAWPTGPRRRATGCEPERVRGAFGATSRGPPPTREGAGAPGEERGETPRRRAATPPFVGTSGRPPPLRGFDAGIAPSEMSWARTKPARSASLFDGRSLRDVDRRSTTRGSCRGAPWTAPRPEGGGRPRRLDRIFSDRGMCSAGGEAVRPCARRATRSSSTARSEGRFRRSRRRALAERGRRPIDSNRRTANVPRNAATVAKAAREGRTARREAIRRAATAEPI
jgi:hypothetical protein